MHFARKTKTSARRQRQRLCFRIKQIEADPRSRVFRIRTSRNFLGTDAPVLSAAIGVAAARRGCSSTSFSINSRRRSHERSSGRGASVRRPSHQSDRPSWLRLVGRGDRLPNAFQRAGRRHRPPVADKSRPSHTMRVGGETAERMTVHGTSGGCPQLLCAAGAEQTESCEFGEHCSPPCRGSRSGERRQTIA